MARKQTYKTAAEAEKAMADAKAQLDELQAAERESRKERLTRFTAYLARIEDELGPTKAEKLMRSMEKMLEDSTATKQSRDQNPTTAEPSTLRKAKRILI